MMNNLKCSDYGSNVEESSGGGTGLGLPNWNVEAHVVSSGPPSGPECPDVRRDNVIFISIAKRCSYNSPAQRSQPIPIHL